MRPAAQGSPRPVVTWQKVVAPSATNETWHRETWFDTSVSRKSEANTITNTAPSVYTGRRLSNANGRTIAVPMPATRRPASSGRG